MSTDGVDAPTPGPAVSVFVTTYADAAFVEEALDSLVAQTCRDFEVIITDDASPDDTAAVIRRWLDRTGFPAEFVRNPENQGICANRNQVLRSATGEFGVFPVRGRRVRAPSDRAPVSALPPGPARHRGGRLQRHGQRRRVRSCPAGYLPGAHPGWAFAAGMRPARNRLLSEGNALPAPATTIRRSCIDAVGGYDESIPVEDYQMWLKLAERWDLRCLPEVLVRNRVLGSSLSRAARYREANRRATAQVLAPWLGRTEWDQAIAARLGSWDGRRSATVTHGAPTWTFRHLAATDALRVRTVATLVGHPVGRRALRALAGVRRRLPRPLRHRLGHRW